MDDIVVLHVKRRDAFLIGEALKAAYKYYQHAGFRPVALYSEQNVGEVMFDLSDNVVGQIPKKVK